jgi:hypothetical protein
MAQNDTTRMGGNGSASTLGSSQSVSPAGAQSGSLGTTGVGTGSGTVTSTAGASGGYAGASSAGTVSHGTSSATGETARPVGSARVDTHASATPIATQSERESYRPAGRELVVMDRAKSRPSTSAIIGSAVAGAIAGGAIPFMLSGRKSGGRTVEAGHASTETRDDLIDASGSGRRGRFWKRRSRV